METKDYIRGYIRTDRAWFAPALNLPGPEIQIGLYPSNFQADPTTAGEARVTWIVLDARQSATPRLEIFSDAWHLLESFSDLIPALIRSRDEQNELTPDGFCYLLERFGFVNMTPYTEPGTLKSPAAQPGDPTILNGVREFIASWVGDWPEDDWIWIGSHWSLNMYTDKNTGQFLWKLYGNPDEPLAVGETIRCVIDPYAALG